MTNRSKVSTKKLTEREDATIAGNSTSWVSLRAAALGLLDGRAGDRRCEDVGLVRLHLSRGRKWTGRRGGLGGDCVRAGVELDVGCGAGTGVMCGDGEMVVLAAAGRGRSVA